MTPPDATPPPEKFAESRRVATGLGWNFAHVAETGSTNTDLAEQARAGERGPAVLATDHQTAGRGRLDRTWQDDGQSQLMVSVRLPIEGPVADAAPGWITGAVVAAARHAVAEAGAPVGFKWPNDLMIETPTVVGKLAGVLSEFVAGEPAVVIVGMGLNLAPPGIEGAASLQDVGCAIGRDALLSGLLTALPERLAEPALVRAELVEHSVTLGRRVRVEQPAGELVGEAVDIDAEGCLVVAVDGELHRVTVGDVVHLRPVQD